MRNHRAAILGGFFLASLLFVGCGDNLTEVAGTVQFDGQPVEEGSITFTPIDNKGRTGAGVIKGGKYTAKAPIGKMKVSFTYPKIVGKRKAYDTPDSPEISEYKDELLDKYGADKTQIEFEVKSGRNKKDWDLTSK